MTSGERMVWAAEFVRVRADGIDPPLAAQMASEAVTALHQALDGSQTTDARVMLLDMISNGAD